MGDDKLWGAAIAFLGGIIALIVNTANTHWAVRRQIQRDAHLLRVALRAELISLREAMDAEKLYINAHEFTWFPIIDFFRFFKNKLDQIGILTGAEVSAAINAFYRYEEHTGYIARHGGVDMSKPIMGVNVPLHFEPPEEAEERPEEVEERPEEVEERPEEVEERRKQVEERRKRRFYVNNDLDAIIINANLAIDILDKALHREKEMSSWHRFLAMPLRDNP